MIYFEHTYQYSADGKTLSEIPDFRSRITRFDSHTVIADGRLYIYDTKKDKDVTAGITSYFDDKNRGVIIRLFNPCPEKGIAMIIALRKHSLDD